MALAHLEPSQVGHHDVQDHQVKALGREGGDGVAARVTGTGAKALGLEQPHDEVGDGGLIVHDEHGGRVRDARRLGRVCHA